MASNDSFVNFEKIMDKGIFFIPRYQRGYSWSKDNINVFLDDLDQTSPRESRYHYTGQIITQQRSETEISILDEQGQKICFDSNNDTLLHIVDGQQRLTTSFLILHVLLKKNEKEKKIEQVFGKPYQSYLDRLIYRDVDKKKELKLNYIIEDQSKFFYNVNNLISEIIDDPKKEFDVSNLYHKNLIEAVKTISERINKLAVKNESFSKLIENLLRGTRFTYIPFEVKESIDIYVIFETMNDRGKQLTNLEKLKNRLIYLSTLVKTESPEDDTDKLRDDINSTWMTIYGELGKDKQEKIQEDIYLKDHWIMYYSYDRSEDDVYRKQIFDKHFTRSRAIDTSLKIENIEIYIKSLFQSVKNYYFIHYPDNYIDREISKLLGKISRLQGKQYFYPIILASLNFVNGNEENVKMLFKEIERFLFTIYYISDRNSNTGSYAFLRQSNELYKSLKDNDLIKQRGGLEATIKVIKDWVDGKNYFNPENLKTLIQDKFAISDGKGFRDWKGTEYLLYEYYCEKKNYTGDYSNFKLAPILDLISKPIEPKTQVTLKSIYQEHFSKYLNDSKNGHNNLFILSHTLGNWRLDTDDSFDLKKWSPGEIKNRGIEILDFAEKHWKISLGSTDLKTKILNLEFLKE